MKVTVQQGSITSKVWRPIRRNVMQRISVAGVLVPLLIAFVAGCAMLASPEWGDNYALEATCTVPELIDGNMYSTGKTLPAEYIKGQPADDSRYTDVILTFEEPKDIRKLVVRRRSEDNAPVDINVFAMINDKWKEISSSTRGASKDDISIHLRATTSKIKIRSQRATRTAKGKSALAAGREPGARRFTQVETILRKPLKYAEIEVYGIKPKTESKES